MACHDCRMSEIVLEVADLRRLCTLFLDAVERRHGSRIDLSSLAVDYYWDLPLRAAFDMVNDPAPRVGAGQVSDDLSELHHLLDRSTNEGMILWHDVAHLCGLLRAMAFADLPDD